MQKLILLIIGVFIKYLVFSQSVSPELISAAGETYANSLYQLDWSIGECITETQSGGSFIITQGFHQNTYIVSKVEDLAKNVSINVYPNPTNNFIQIDFNSNNTYSNIIEIKDINGRILFMEKNNTSKKQLSFKNYTNGIYFLTIKQGNRLIKSFKIIKN